MPLGSLLNKVCTNALIFTYYLYVFGFDYCNKKKRSNPDAHGWKVFIRELDYAIQVI
jgi:hypothetical protein